MLRPTSEPKRPEPPESPTCQLGAKTVIKAWLCPLSKTPPRSAAEDICTDEGLPFLLMTLPALKVIEPFILIVTMPSTFREDPPLRPISFRQYVPPLIVTAFPAVTERSPRAAS